MLHYAFILSIRMLCDFNGIVEDNFNGRLTKLFSTEHLDKNLKTIKQYKIIGRVLTTMIMVAYATDGKILHWRKYLGNIKIIYCRNIYIFVVIVL